MLNRRPLVLAAAACALLTAACGAGSSTGTGSPAGTGTSTVPAATASPIVATSGATPSAAPAASGRKVLILVEENKTYAEALGGPQAPYLTTLARTYGLATQMQAGYPGSCPSLAAYILMTSGSTHGICDDRDPSAHLLPGPSIFSQVQASGRQWRSYAESMPSNCTRTNSADGLFAVRHVPSIYYPDLAAQCQKWAVPLGTGTSGALHDDLAAGTLPAFSMITPNLCNDMHGASGCGDQVPTGDAWLSRWMPRIMSSPDYRSGKLVVFVTWDEGTHTDNHIPTLVISPATHRITAATHWTHCSLLRTSEEILGLAPLGCAATAPSMRAAFGL